MLDERTLIKTLDRDLVWRRREIFALIAQCSSKDKELSSAATRASVAIMYAHWEGYVKRISCDYAEFISSKRLRYRNLKPCFWGLAAVEHVNVLHDVKKRVFVASETLQKISSINNDRVNIDLRSKMDRIGNLNYDLFAQIISFIGISTLPYETKKFFIDERLLALRNEIAHGNFVPLDPTGVLILRESVFEILEIFRTDIQNALSTKSYMV